MKNIKDSKLFFDVFPTLETGDDIKELFKEVKVTKVATNRNRDYINIHIYSNHLINKETIFLVEKAVKKQLFSYRNISTKIYETFELSRQYDLNTLLKEYRQSILLELSQFSALTSSILAKGVFEVISEDVLLVELNDSVVSDDKKDIIDKYLTSVLNNRFGFLVEVRFRYSNNKRRYTKPYMNDLSEQGDISNQIQSVETDIESNGDNQELDELNNDFINSNTKKIVSNETDAQNMEGGKEEAVKTKRVNEGLNDKKTRIEKSKSKSYTRRAPKLKNDSSVIFGRNFDDQTIELESVISEMGEIAIKGQIIGVDTREIRDEKTILTFKVTDFTDTIVVKMFIKNEMLPDALEGLKKGEFVKIKGVTTIDKFDRELTIASVSGIKKISDFRKHRKDLSKRKRVELHCHTKMSDMDAVASVTSLINRAKEWGHQAIAITDHGVVQSFPEANNVMRKLGNDDHFKVIYGVEGYVVDDLKEIAVGAGKQTLDDTYVVFDIETTGFSPISDKIIEIGALKITDGEIVASYSSFVNPKRPIPYRITGLTGITDDMVIDSPTIETVLLEFLSFVGENTLVAHNADFDIRFIEQNCRYLDIEKKFTSVDTLALARMLLPTLTKYNLNLVAKALGTPLENHHRAIDDARATAFIYMKFVQMLKDRRITTLKEINQFGHMNPDGIRKLPTHHIIILAKNDVGRLNLYKLISMSHVHYFNRRPRIPKSELNRHREGLIIGSACENGEIYQGILRNRPKEEIVKLAEFYDYYEIQPLANNAFMIGSERYPDIKSEENLMAINREIVELGQRFDKPVVATGDVHFLEPEDQLYRRIIMAGKGYKDIEQPPLYFKTTEEMLEDFAYLGESKAKEVVIENTNIIADMIEKISPLSADKCVPTIENSDQELREICYRKAKETYGDKLPEAVESRLERELNSIISNGYAVMYIIAQKLVWKSLEDGYLVGSRGSVGSSFAATMAGITEVNPLAPHYYCKNCFFTDFDSTLVREYAGGCGFDMPDRDCPFCGRKLIKDGFDIPFETFLGFEGDKEPDIDLNFSGDYQAKAHQYVEVLFSDGYTFRAGTIGTMAEKTAFGFVKSYFEERQIGKRNSEIDRIVSNCVGIRRSTGQHPGGIIVLPKGRDINEFTPIQRPANDMNSTIITTHFDYHSIDHNLLKLDILGHDDPTMIKTLEEYINSPDIDNEFNKDNPFNATDIPLDDKDVLSLFYGTKALGIKPEDIGDCKLGCLGIPEFGTDFVIKMVQDAKPKSLSDLIRISGLSHGADVWLNNAQDLIKTGEATISTCICTRDDIMVYLINQGMDSALAFNIMEDVRKGKKLKPEWEDSMRDKNIPEWYIQSCNKITYMFPKAHAAAYVMMAYRIAYCKIKYPLAYYGAFFGIRAKAFDYELMCLGKEKLNHHLTEYKGRVDKLTKKEEMTLDTMKIVQEMYARGFEFTPIDIYKARASRFLIIDGKLMPSLSTIDGLGEVAAEAIEVAAKQGSFLSMDDFKQRTGVNKTVIELMESLDLFGRLPKSNQLSLFDL